MLIIPNLLNIPQLMLGTGTASSVIGVAMHYSSRASKSRYCSLHTACFALRRGIPAAVLGTNAFNEEQAVAVDAALRLSTMPSTMNRDCRDLLYEVHKRDDVEWIVSAVWFVPRFFSFQSWHHGVFLFCLYLTEICFVFPLWMRWWIWSRICGAA